MVAASALAGEVPGVLRRYGSHGLVYFQFGNGQAAAHPAGAGQGGAPAELADDYRVAILLPGLTDGLLAIPYFEGLAGQLHRFGFARVLQPVFHASWMEYGVSSLDKDVENLCELVQSIASPARPITELLLVGHSTGCQDIVRFLTLPRTCGALFGGPLPVAAATPAGAGGAGPPGKLVLSVRCVLQGAISDPKLLLVDGHDPKEVERCKKFRRVNSDVFSRDRSNAELAEEYAGLASTSKLLPVRMHFVQSRRDEYAGFGSLTEYEEFMQRLLSVVNGVAGGTGVARSQDGDAPESSKAGAEVATVFYHGGSHTCGENCAEIETEIARFVLEESPAAVRSVLGHSAPKNPSAVVCIPRQVLDFAQRIREGDLQHARLIAVAGVPGAGKTTCAGLLASLLDTHVLSMDGFHHPLAKLRTFEKPEEAVYWRGAPYTFDDAGLHSCLQETRRFFDRARAGRDPGAGGEAERFSVAHWPEFDHAVGDPVFPRGTPWVAGSSSTAVSNGHSSPEKWLSASKPLIVEGNYLLHWPHIVELFDLKVFLDEDINEAVRKLKIRNQCIPGYTKEEIERRCELVDRTNAETVARSKDKADLCISMQVNKF